MSVEQVIMLFCEMEKDDYVSKEPGTIREVVKCLKDKMPWSPQPSDLEPEKCKTPYKLNEFLTCLVTVQKENEIRSRSATLRYSLAQDIVYIVTSGRGKTPKSLLLQSVIKTLMNNTEL